MQAYEALMQFQRETEALSQVAGRLSWDQETMMPQGAAEQRAEESGALQSVLHARRTDARVGDWLEASEGAVIEDPVVLAQLREIRRGYDRTRRVPADLAAALARQTALAQGIWARARAEDDFAGFAPCLGEIIALKRQEGAALSEGGDVYDALLEDYEPGTSARELEAMFARLRPGLVALREVALGAGHVAPVAGAFDEAKQLQLSRRIAEVFGYDLSRGRIDKAVHPFSSGSGSDVRITTRTSATDPFNCLYSTIHEVGHACYEQAIDGAYALSALGRGVSMGVHESQSRIYENQLGRSRAFTGWLFAQMRDLFGDFGVADEDAFYKVVNRLHRGFIRTEADEVQYNLHVLLRFDLERALISGDLAVQDLEGAWNDRFEADFGYPVTRASDGCLQDVHWSVGLFGYFPTYTLGNVYAGCLHEALRDALPDLDDQMAQGDTRAATAWLRDAVQQHGGLFAPRDLISRACGRTPSEAPLSFYLQEKFGGLYGV